MVREGHREARSLTNLLVVENIADEGAGLYLDGVLDTYVVNNTLVGNDASSSGAHLYAEAGTVRFINNVFAWGQDGGGIYGDATAAAGSDIYYNDAYANSGGEYAGSFTSQTGLSGNLDVDPDLKSYTIDGDETNDDLHLNLNSPSVDAGHPAIFDVDGTVSDIGAYGGPDADVQDSDGDGYFDHVDCDDSDSSIYPGAVEIPYDGIDQDCDGTDERDVDDDGFEDPAWVEKTATTPMPRSTPMPPRSGTTALTKTAMAVRTSTKMGTGTTRQSMAAPTAMTTMPA